MDRVYNWYICVPDEFQTVYGIQSSYHNATTTRQNKEMRTKWCIWMADTVYIYWDIPRCSVYIHSSSATEYNNCPDVFSYYELPQTTTLYSVQTTNYPVNPKPTNMPLCSKTHAHCRFCTPYIHHHTRQQLPCNIAYNPCQDPFLPASFIHSFIDFLYVEIRVQQAKKPNTAIINKVQQHAYQSSLVCLLNLPIAHSWLVLSVPPVSLSLPSFSSISPFP